MPLVFSDLKTISKEALNHKTKPFNVDELAENMVIETLIMETGFYLQLT